VAEEVSPIDEATLTHEAVLGSFWSGSRLLVGGVTFLYAGFAFAYFYLRQTNSNGLWKPHGVSAPFGSGTAVLLLVAASVAGFLLAADRAARGDARGWFLAGWTSLALGLAAVGVQIALLTHLGFGAGSSGFASVFVGWAPVHATVLFGAMYWVETLLARSVRDRQVLPGPTAMRTESERFVANVEACRFFYVYLGIVTLFFYVVLYLL
jgi:heme/copper-type cytochrome/quinol oxidase subunit 3